MNLQQLTSPASPAVQLADRFGAHFAAFGVDEVVPSAANELTLKFDQKSGFEHAVATMAIKGSIDGVKLLFDLADGAAVPRMLPGVQYAIPTYRQLPGVVDVRVGETFPQQVTLVTDGRQSASDAVTLLNPTLPGGSSVGVQIADIAPNA